VVMASLVALLATGVGRRTRFAIGTSVVAPLPGLVFVAHTTAIRVMMPGVMWAPWDLWTIIPAPPGVPAGPLVLLRSFLLVRPRRVPGTIEAFRGCLAVGWLASSFVTLVHLRSV
jgi:hypothetical protein